jgi:plasmid stabilization system protein ParE
VARVEVTAPAREDLNRLIRSHSLPADTRARVRRSLRHLETFPLAGPLLEGRWRGYRFVLGPWRWLVVVYDYLEEDDRVLIVTFQDGRSSSGPDPP